MLVNPQKMLLKAKAEGYGIGSFNVLNLEIAKGVIDAAIEMKQDVMLQITDSAFQWLGNDYLLPGLVQRADIIRDINIALHYDHVYNLDHFTKYINDGFTSGMYDGSKLPIEENIKNSLIAKANAKRFVDIFVELEVGAIGGKEDSVVSNAKSASFEEIVDFYHQTKPDALAAPFGTSHGVFKSEIKLDYELMKALSKAIPVPLVLHGSSGLSEEQIRTSIASGITKVNVGTDLLLVYNEAIRKYYNEQPEEYDIRKINQVGILAVKEKTKQYLSWFK